MWFEIKSCFFECLRFYFVEEVCSVLFQNYKVSAIFTVCTKATILWKKLGQTLITTQASHIVFNVFIHSLLHYLRWCELFVFYHFWCLHILFILRIMTIWVCLIKLATLIFNALRSFRTLKMWIWRNPLCWIVVFSRWSHYRLAAIIICCWGYLYIIQIWILFVYQIYLNLFILSAIKACWFLWSWNHRLRFIPFQSLFFYI